VMKKINSVLIFIFYLSSFVHSQNNNLFFSDKHYSIDSVSLNDDFKSDERDDFYYFLDFINKRIRAEYDNYFKHIYPDCPENWLDSLYKPLKFYDDYTLTNLDSSYVYWGAGGFYIPSGNGWEDWKYPCHNYHDQNLNISSFNNDLKIHTIKYYYLIEWEQKSNNIKGNIKAIGFGKQRLKKTISPIMWVKTKELEKYLGFYTDFIYKLYFTSLPFKDYEKYPKKKINARSNEIKVIRRIGFEDSASNILYTKLYQKAIESDRVHYYKTDTTAKPTKFNTFSKEDAVEIGSYYDEVVIIDEEQWIDTVFYSPLETEYLTGIIISEIWTVNKKKNIKIKRKNNTYALLYYGFIGSKLFEYPIFWLTNKDLKKLLNRKDYKKIKNAIFQSF
jgi:hypothetical protein